MNQAAAAANAYLEIQTAARQASEIDFPAWTVKVAELTARCDKQNKTAQPTRLPARQANIDDGGQPYAVDTSANQSEAH